jgi:hypothetical protein
MTDKLPPEPSPWLVFTTAEVANIMKVSPPTVRAWNERGELEALKGVLPLRFSSIELYNFINRKPK